VLLVLALVLMSEITHAWLLYLGLVFTFMVMLAPGGIASLIMMNLRLASFGRLRPLVAGYLALGGSAAAALLGASAMIEMTYRLQLDDARSPTMNFLGLTLDLRAADSWFGAGFVLLVGGLLFELVRRQFAGQWSQAQGQIEREHREREAAL
jgi:branched-chain amino acid transport system permease protein